MLSSENCVFLADEKLNDETVWDMYVYGVFPNMNKLVVSSLQQWFILMCTNYCVLTQLIRELYRQDFHSLSNHYRIILSSITVYIYDVKLNYKCRYTPHFTI